GSGDDSGGARRGGRGADDGAGLEWASLLKGVRTPVPLVTADEPAEPKFSVYGQDIASTVLAQPDRLTEAVEACDALFVSSNTLVGEDEREVTMAARHHALELGQPLVFDPNLRLDRWPTAARAAAASREVIPG